jgi:hypothetical protein
MSGNTRIKPQDVDVVIKFGGGLHTRASPDEIDPREAADGYNFLIDIENRNLRNRPPFDKIGTLPNGQQCNGGFSLLKADGTVSTCFQGGGTVYQWNGLTGFTSIGTVNSSSKLRGHWKTQNWPLGANNKVLITDLAQADVVKEWDGTTFQSTTFTNQAGSGFGSFYARYLNIDNERAVWGNVKDAGGTSPHMMVGSKTSDYTVISVTNVPSNSLSASDPYFLLSPDLKPINALVESFGTTMVSTEKGQIFALTGTSAQNFNFQPFFAGSAATGQEAMSDMGNDIIYGRMGRLESVIDTNTYGNAAAADASVKIANVIDGYTGWTLVFNSRTRKLYAFPTGVSEVWVLDTAIRAAGQISPWMRWKTDREPAWQPTFVDAMLDPIDGLEYIIMGDSTGDIYRVEGTGVAGDGGEININVQFLTKLFSAKLDANVYDVTGYIKYQRASTATINLTFQYQGTEIFDKSLSVDLPNVAGAPYFGGGAYFGGGYYFGSVSGRLARQKFWPPGQANEFQLLVDYSGTNNISINEIGLRFREAS